jgi:copper resistance protein C
MRRAAAVLAAALTVVVVTTAPAGAHTTLTSSDPRKGATVTSPRQIRLTFGDPVRFTGVVVLDAKGGHHESGTSQAVDNQVTEQVAGVLVPGVYTVGWRVVAPDGHPVTGEYRFTVKGSGAAASAPSSSAAPPAGPVSTPAAESSKQTSSGGWWWIGLGILVVALAGGGLALVRRRR